MPAITRLGPNALPGVPYTFTAKASAITYVTVDTIRLLEDSVSRLFEVVMRQTTGTAFARLWDKTASAVIDSSTLSTTSGSFVRLRTGALVLKKGNEYQAQFGTAPLDVGESVDAFVLKVP